ncbi:MAG TPA: hypothetical protein VNG53_07425 [Bacteroidia bacterium]|nr:hypothetical protein [Bacteroidia bacterium]
MKKIIFVFLFLSVGFTPSNYVLVKTLPETCNYFTTDNLQNLYLVKNNLLEEFDENGNLLKTYSNNSLGNISYVDATNPLKIILFYSDFSQIVFLDNTLSQNGSPVSLSDIGLSQAQLICSSNNNGTWIYNAQNFELVRIDQSLQKTQQTGNISQLLSITLNPNFLLEYNGKVYLNNPSSGILVFDIYGTYYQTIPIKNLNNFQINGNTLYYFTDDKFGSFNTKTLKQQTYTLPDTNVISVNIQKDRLYLQKKNEVEIYASH